MVRRDGYYFEFGRRWCVCGVTQAIHNRLLLANKLKVDVAKSSTKRKEGGVMCFKRLCILTLTLMALLGFSISSFAHPPVGSFDETYYNGIWNIRFSQTCHRASDGKVAEPLHEVYLEWNLLRRTSLPLVAGCKGRHEPDGVRSIPVWSRFCRFFSIDLPVSYVLSGLVEREIIGNQYVAGCIDVLQAWLYSVLDNSGPKNYTKLTGTSIDVCADSSFQEFFECNNDWIARWIEVLPPP